MSHVRDLSVLAELRAGAVPRTELLQPREPLLMPATGGNSELSSETAWGVGSVAAVRAGKGLATKVLAGKGREFGWPNLPIPAFGLVGFKLLKKIDYFEI